MQTMIEPTDAGRIRTEPCPDCILCGGRGNEVYHGLKDRLFSAPGTWSLKSCADPACGLMWLDPMPLTEDLGKAYLSYYTHASRAGTGGGKLKQISRRMKHGYWAAKYGYPVSFGDLCLGKLMYLFPIRRSEVDAESRFLHAVPNGRVLDVGCGSGDWLMAMRELGWQVAGLDFDANAVKVACARGLEVKCGPLEQQEYPNASFAAVVLNHVIEHVPDPVATLAECARILKPGGKLVLFTPNAASLSHRMFKQDWRGLEPPRHLHLFSTQSLPGLFKRAGFNRVSVRPQVAKSVVYESLMLRRGISAYAPGAQRDRLADLKARLVNLAELCVTWCKPSVADCVAGMATKE